MTISRKITVTEKEDKALHFLWHLVLRTLWKHVTNPECSPDAAWIKVTWLFLRDNGVTLKGKLEDRALLAQELQSLAELGGEEFPFD